MEHKGTGEKHYKIAGLTVKMDTYGRTEYMALPYRIEEQVKSDIAIQTDYRMWKEYYPEMIPDLFEYMMTGRTFYRKLVDYDGMMLHASALIMDGKAYLFSADSGVGKSTHTNLWRRVFGDERVKILNDDKPALRLEDNVWYAYGTPWCGKYGLNLNLKYPVGGICFLKQGPQNKIEPYTGSDLVYQFMKQTSRTELTDLKLKLMDRIDCLVKQVPIWSMECNMETEAALVAYEAMAGK